MAYVEITSEEIASGESNKSTTWTKVKDNFENHEQRLLGIEAGENVQYPCAVLRVNGELDLLSTLTDLVRTTTNFNLSILGVRLLVSTAGSSGTTEIDLLKKSGEDDWVSIFTTRPSVIYSEGDNSVSDNAVLDNSTKTVLAGDQLRLDLIQRQEAGRDFLVRIDYERV